jgi:hypothetical protein
MADFETPTDLTYNRGLIGDPEAFARDANAESWLYFCGEEFASMEGGMSYADVQAAVGESANIVSDPPRNGCDAALSAACAETGENSIAGARYEGVPATAIRIEEIRSLPTLSGDRRLVQVTGSRQSRGVMTTSAHLRPRRGNGCGPRRSRDRGPC